MLSINLNGFRFVWIELFNFIFSSLDVKCLKKLIRVSVLIKFTQEGQLFNVRGLG